MSLDRNDSIHADVPQIFAGVGIAFFWTLFPYPIFESDEIPVHIADSILTLAELHARTHAIVYETISQNRQADPESTKSRRERSAVETKMIQCIARGRKLLEDSKFEVAVVHHFPRQSYTATLDLIDRIFRSLSLMAYSSEAFDAAEVRSSPSLWMRELRQHASPNGEIESRFISALSTCATAFARRQPLPPFVDVPEASSLLDALKESPMSLLDTNHAQEPGYAALATVHASALLLTEDIWELVRLSSEVVGRVEFG